MKILALDTSTSRVTVCFTRDREIIKQVQGGELTGTQFHGELLASLISECLAGDIPDAIAVGRGPGPYTGLRVGITTGEVLAAAWSVPIVGVPTLAALAHGHIRRGGSACIAALDVKRKEIALQEFDADGVAISEPRLLAVSEISEVEGKNLVGPAFVTQTLVTPNVEDASPVDAYDIALIALGQFQQKRAESSAPLYLRAPDAALPAPRKSVL